MKIKIATPRATPRATSCLPPPRSKGRHDHPRLSFNSDRDQVHTRLKALMPRKGISPYLSQQRNHRSSSEAMAMVFSYFGNLIYIGLLLTNAIAILNEERFLAKSKLCRVGCGIDDADKCFSHTKIPCLSLLLLVASVTNSTGLSSVIHCCHVSSSHFLIHLMQSAGRHVHPKVPTRASVMRQIPICSISRALDKPETGRA